MELKVSCQKIASWCLEFLRVFIGQGCIIVSNRHDVIELRPHFCKYAKFFIA